MKVAVLAEKERVKSSQTEPNKKSEHRGKKGENNSENPKAETYKRHREKINPTLY
jgi:hypothetical protein